MYNVLFVAVKSTIKESSREYYSPFRVHIALPKLYIVIQFIIRTHESNQ